MAGCEQPPPGRELGQPQPDTSQPKTPCLGFLAVHVPWCHNGLCPEENDRLVGDGDYFPGVP